MMSYYLTGEQGNSRTQSPDNPKVLDISTPQNVQDKIDTTKETEQTITLIPRKKQNTRISSEEASNHKVVQTNEIKRCVPNNVFDTYYEDYIKFKNYITYYEDYIKFKNYINDALESFNTNNMKDFQSNKNDEEKIKNLESEIKRLNYDNERLDQENIEKGKFIENLINYSTKEKDTPNGNNWVDVSNKFVQSTKRKQLLPNNYHLKNNRSRNSPVVTNNRFSQVYTVCFKKGHPT